MPVIDLNHDNHAQVHALLTDDTWCVACLCAAWCNTCADFRSAFNALASRHSDKLMLWIDIENEAEVAGDFDIDNFPTLLIQRGSRVSFLGAIEPNATIAHRLIVAQTSGGKNSETKPFLEARQPLATTYDLRSQLAEVLSR